MTVKVTGDGSRVFLPTRHQGVYLPTVHEHHMAWVRHHNNCATCITEHHFEPDVKALCADGARLYRGWCQSAQSSEDLDRASRLRALRRWA